MPENTLRFLFLLFGETLIAVVPRARSTEWSIARGSLFGSGMVKTFGLHLYFAANAVKPGEWQRSL